MENNITKIRDSNPLVNVLMSDIWETLSNDKLNGMSVAEVVGCLEFVKNDLITGNWGG